MGFARWCDRNELRIFFPGVWRPKLREHNRISMDESRAFYTVARRVFDELLPTNRGGNLPPTMDAELFRARGIDGKLHFGRRLLDEESARQLGDRLREAIEDAIEDGEPVEWARGFFFLHQIRGVKDGHPHSPHRAAEAFEAFLIHHGLSADVLEQNSDKWVVDIGVEASSTSGEDSLAIRADSHYHIAVDICEIDPAQAERMTSTGSSLYVKDHTSHLVDVAGCRIDTGTGPSRGALGILKIQAYHTDKNITASPAEGAGFHAKHTTLSQMADKNHPGFFDKLYNLFEESQKAGIVSSARIEARIPYRHQHRFYAEGNQIDLRKYLVAVPCEAWW